MKQVEIFTDGACSGNPGPGGWGAILRYNEHEKEISGGEAVTTNNRMEISAVIGALSLLKRRTSRKRALRPFGGCRGAQVFKSLTDRFLYRYR